MLIKYQDIFSILLLSVVFFLGITQLEIAFSPRQRSILYSIPRDGHHHFSHIETSREDISYTSAPEEHENLSPINPAETVYSEPFQTLFLSPVWGDLRVTDLSIESIHLPSAPRGQLTGKTLRIKSGLSQSDTYGVALHEYVHAIHLQKIHLGQSDIIDDFLALSWLSTDIKKPGLGLGDFVSGYALTNAYEDFAESSTFFLFHNKDFFEKTKRSPLLKRKYEILSQVFPQKFLNTSFSSNKVPDYFWDATRLEKDTQKILEFFLSF